MTAFKIDENLPPDVAEVLRIIRQLAPTLHNEPLAGRLWIVTEQGIRIHTPEN